MKSKIFTGFAVLFIFGNSFSSFAQEETTPKNASAQNPKEEENYRISARGDKEIKIKNVALENTKEEKLNQPIDWRKEVSILQNEKESLIRKAAAERLQKFETEKIPHELSRQLAKTILTDQSKEVRKQTALAMKSLNDEAAAGYLINIGTSPNISSETRLAAADGIRWMDNPQVLSRVVRIATLIVRAGWAREVEPPQIIYLTNGGDVDNPLGTINLPIELPELEIVSATGAIAVYAGEMMKMIARRDIGGNRLMWKRWFQDWKRIRAARIEADKKKIEPAKFTSDNK